MVGSNVRTLSLSSSLRKMKRLVFCIYRSILGVLVVVEESSDIWVTSEGCS